RPTVSAALRRCTGSPDFFNFKKRNFLAGVISKKQKAGLVGRFWLRQNKRRGLSRSRILLEVGSSGVV
ncbi:MAG: hypothetical protein ACREGD_03190, partial [Candidatus Saccharimonadales bacterium]